MSKKRLDKVRALYKDLKVPESAADVYDSDSEDDICVNLTKLPCMIVNPEEDSIVDNKSDSTPIKTNRFPSLLLMEGDSVSSRIESYAKTYFLSDDAISNMYEHVAYQLQYIKQFNAVA